MTEDELKQFKELAGKYERGKDKEAVKKIFSESIHEVFQEVNDGGHSAATKTKQAEIDALSTQLTEVKTRAETAEGKLKAFDDKAPDVAKVRETYEAAEKALRQQYDETIKNTEAKFTQQLTEKEQALLNTRLDVTKRDLVSRLVDPKFGVDKEYAETVLMAKPEVAGRLKVDADGSVKVLKKGSTDMYIVPAEGRTAIDHLAEELGDTVDERWKTTGVRGGSGSRGSEGGGGKAGTGQQFEALRERVQAQEKARSETRATSGLDRLGGRRT